MLCAEHMLTSTNICISILHKTWKMLWHHTEIVEKTTQNPHLQTFHFDEIFEAIHNEQLLVLVHLGNVSRVQPALQIYGCFGGLLVFVITLHELWTFHT